MIERADLDFACSEAELTAWCAWLEHHGIDPCEVSLRGWVERSEARRRVRWLAYRFDERGHHLRTADGADVVREVCVCQLEAVPSPFPTRD